MSKHLFSHLRTNCLLHQRRKLYAHADVIHRGDKMLIYTFVHQQLCYLILQSNCATESQNCLTQWYVKHEEHQHPHLPQ